MVISGPHKQMESPLLFRMRNNKNKNANYKYTHCKLLIGCWMVDCFAVFIYHCCVKCKDLICHSFGLWPDAHLKMLRIYSIHSALCKQNCFPHKPFKSLEWLINERPNQIQAKMKI